MRSILIPTNYHEDTIHAMELSFRNATTEPVKVVLLTLSPLPDSELPLLFLSSGYDENQNNEERLFDQWEMRKSLLGISVEVIQHHQYGASTPLMQQIIERYGINAIIVPFSIQRSEDLVYNEALESFENIKCKITKVPEREVSFSIE